MNRVLTTTLAICILGVLLAASCRTTEEVTNEKVEIKKTTIEME